MSFGADLNSLLACYTADLNGVKGLNGYKYQSPAMTSQTCRAACKGQGFALSGTYNGDRTCNYRKQSDKKAILLSMLQSASVGITGLGEACYQRFFARPNAQVSQSPFSAKQTLVSDLY